MTPPGGYRLNLSPLSRERLAWLKENNQRRWKKVKNALAHLQADPKYPSLKAHKYDELKGQAPGGGDMWVAYVENNTPSAWRIFFYHDKLNQGVIGIASIEPHYR